MQTFLLYLVPFALFSYIAGIAGVLALIVSVLVSWIVFGMLSAESKDHVAKSSPLLAAFFDHRIDEKEDDLVWMEGAEKPTNQSPVKVKVEMPRPETVARTLHTPPKKRVRKQPQPAAQPDFTSDEPDLSDF